MKGDTRSLGRDRTTSSMIMLTQDYNLIAHQIGENDNEMDSGLILPQILNPKPLRPNQIPVAVSKSWAAACFPASMAPLDLESEPRIPNRV